MVSFFLAFNKKMPSLCTVKLREDWLTALVSVNTLPVSLSRVKCAAYTRHKNLGVTCHPPSAASTTSLGDTQTQWSTALGPALALEILLYTGLTGLLILARVYCLTGTASRSV